MNTQRIDVAMAVTGIFFVGLAVFRLAEVEISDANAIDRSVYLELVSVDSSQNVVSEYDATSLNGRNPFRFSNRPASVRYGEMPVPTVDTERYRPELALRATVGGPPWTALISGLPGRSSIAVVKVGEKIDSLYIQNITHSTAIVRGPDTTWVLSLSRGQP